MDLTGIKGIGPATAEKLRAAGVDRVSKLALSDPADLAHRTGLPEARLAAWIAEARGGSATPGRSAAVAKASMRGARVVLAEGLQRARVKVEQDVVAELPIITARVKESVEVKLKEFQGNVVVLKEKADTALIRVEQEVYEGLPLFKEKLEEGAAEVRVRVAEIREKRVEPVVRNIGTRLRGLFRRNGEER